MTNVTIFIRYIKGEEEYVKQNITHLYSTNANDRIYDYDLDVVTGEKRPIDPYWIPVQLALSNRIKLKIQPPPYYSITIPPKGGPLYTYRYVNHNQEDSDALSHLEEIVNGFRPEQEALLYVNYSGPDFISKISLNILRYGRSSVIWKYEIDPKKILGDSGYKPINNVGLKNPYIMSSNWSIIS